MYSLRFYYLNFVFVFFRLKSYIKIIVEIDNRFTGIDIRLDNVDIQVFNY